MSSPAATARHAVPSPNVAAKTCRTSIPASRAPSGSRATARMARPVSVRVSSSQSTAATSTAPANPISRGRDSSIGPAATTSNPASPPKLRVSPPNPASSALRMMIDNPSVTSNTLLSRPPDAGPITNRCKA